ncbi:uncharacterized protein JCM6883_003484 [Sporobolomyces salmoneus]|uniref:uncharacterized protein n=1 Tax=Sporobolomyces salmoneus TaxID=183962 RepID=UPI00317C0508
MPFWSKKPRDTDVFPTVPTYEVLDEFMSESNEIHQLSSSQPEHDKQARKLRAKIRKGHYARWTKETAALFHKKAREFVKAAMDEHHYHVRRNFKVESDAVKSRRYEEFYVDVMRPLVHEYLRASDVATDDRARISRNRLANLQSLLDEFELDSSDPDPVARDQLPEIKLKFIDAAEVEDEYWIKSRHLANDMEGHLGHLVEPFLLRYLQANDIQGEEQRKEARLHRVGVLESVLDKVFPSSSDHGSSQTIAPTISR